MKRLPFVLLLIFLFSASVYAGDLPESLITHENCDVFIGEIVEIAAGKVTINVSHALFDNYDVASITVDEFIYMTDDNRYKTPQVGDYCTIAAEYIVDAGNWSIVYMAAKSDSLDPQTLKLYGGNNAFIERMNHYINDGTYSYKYRKQMLDKTNEDAVTIAKEDEAKRIAKETKIVTQPPTFNEAVKRRTTFWVQTPIVKYTVITLFATLISYLVARNKAPRRKNKE